MKMDNQLNLSIYILRVGCVSDRHIARTLVPNDATTSKISASFGIGDVKSTPCGSLKYAFDFNLYLQS